MTYGYHGKFLRVHLSSGTLSEETHDENWYRRYVGGAGVVAYYLLKELSPKTVPLGPDNLLVIAPGVLTGTPVAGTGRNCVGAKSPLTGTIGKSEAGGHFGAELKRAGYDGIIVDGRSDTPVYLWINDGTAELRDASGLWGKPVLETGDAIRAETGEPNARIACIGPAGERLVRFACIMNDEKNAAGRGGMGAVMGSKNLKAIAVRGRGTVPVADPERVKELAKFMSKEGPVRARSFHEFGTGEAMVGQNAAGNIPARNFRDGYFDNMEAISAPTLKETIGTGMHGCYACSIRCKKVVKVDQPWTADPRYGGPEYETLGAFGSVCGIDNLAAIARAHHICNAYGMDTISAGVAVGFVMECFEQGYLTSSDLDGLEPAWGNAEAMLKLLEMTGERQGIGNLLAEGSKKAAEAIGKGAEQLSMQVKGLELPMHEPRLKMGIGMCYSISNTGADHCTGIHDPLYEKDGPGLNNDGKPLGILEPLPANDLSTRKVAFAAQLHKWRHFGDSACMCQFVPWRYAETVELVKAVTGWNSSLVELLAVGERAITLGRMFNIREGFTPADDSLPERFFSPPANGRLAEIRQAISHEQMEKAIRDYYLLMGWDESTGIPRRETLERLDVLWAMETLSR